MSHWVLKYDVRSIVISNTYTALILGLWKLSERKKKHLFNVNIQITIPDYLNYKFWGFFPNTPFFAFTGFYIYNLAFIPIIFVDALERNVKFLQEKNRKLEEENHNIRDMLSSTCGCIPDGNATSQKYQVLDGAINVPMVKKEHAKRLLVEG